MKILVAVDTNWAIGYRGGMLFTLPKDLEFFRTVTMGEIVVTGRSTLATFPNGRPLEGRKTVILSHFPGLSKEFEGEDVIVTTIEGLPEALSSYYKSGKEVYIIGGGSVYRQLLPHCSTAIITHVQEAAEQVDTFFPNLDLEKHWKLTESSDIIEDNGHAYKMKTYKNVKLDSIF